MTYVSDVAAPFSGPFPAGLIRRLYRDEPLFTAAGLFVALSMVPTIAAYLIDTRQINGINIWDKPLKFDLALTVWLLTLAFYARFLPAGTLGRSWYRIYSIIVVAAVAAEIIWIKGASANGIASHFNETTALMAALYPVMGLLAIVVASAAAVYGVLIRGNIGSQLSPGLRQAVWTSLLATFVMTVLAAGVLVKNGGHWVGGGPSDAGGSLFFDWSRDGGDLRVPHFFATHILHIAPLAAFGVERLTGRLSVRDANLITGATCLFVLAVLAQALAGTPFLPGIL